MLGIHIQPDIDTLACCSVVLNLIHALGLHVQRSFSCCKVDIDNEYYIDKQMAMICGTWPGEWNDDSDKNEMHTSLKIVS